MWLFLGHRQGKVLAGERRAREGRPLRKTRGISVGRASLPAPEVLSALPSEPYEVLPSCGRAVGGAAPRGRRGIRPALARAARPRRGRRAPWPGPPGCAGSGGRRSPGRRCKTARAGARVKIRRQHSSASPDSPRCRCTTALRNQSSASSGSSVEALRRRLRRAGLRNRPASGAPGRSGRTASA